MYHNPFRHKPSSCYERHEQWTHVRRYLEIEHQMWSSAPMYVVHHLWQHPPPFNDIIPFPRSRPHLHHVIWHTYFLSPPFATIALQSHSRLFLPYEKHRQFTLYTQVVGTLHGLPTLQNRTVCLFTLINESHSPLNRWYNNILPSYLHQKLPCTPNSKLFIHFKFPFIVFIHNTM